MAEETTGSLKLTDETFDSAIKENNLIVVDFWAEWCGPCKMMGPIIEELAAEKAGKIMFGKLNVDENKTTAQKFQVMSIPTMIVFKNGEAVDTLVGAMSKEDLAAKVEQHVG